MDFQMIMSYIAANWLWLLVSLILGFLLAWLFTGRPASKRANASEVELANLRSKQREIQRQLDDALQDAEKKAAVIKKGVDDLEEAKTRNETLAEELTATQADLGDKQADLLEKNDKLEMLDATLVSKTSEYEALTHRLTHADEQLEALKSQMSIVAVAKSREIETLSDSLESARSENAELNTQIEAANANISAMTAELLETRATYDRLSAEMDSVNTANTGLSTELELTRSTKASLEKELQESIAFNQQEEGQLAELNNQVRLLQTELDSANEEVQRKDTALSEAYGRAVALEQSMHGKDALVAVSQEELDEARQLLERAAVENKVLQNRVAEVRGEVAGEMALMTSTMMREKDAVIAEANARIAALAEEIRTLKAGA